MNFWEAYQEMKKGEKASNNKHGDKIKYFISPAKDAVQVELHDNFHSNANLWIQDLDSEWYIVKEKTITITESQFDEAYKAAIDQWEGQFGGIDFEETIKKKLGF